MACRREWRSCGGITTAIKKASGGRITTSPGSVHLILMKLKDLGWLEVKPPKSRKRDDATTYKATRKALQSLATYQNFREDLETIEVSS